jgi:hypothetical protein
MRRLDLIADCSRCAALCCIATPFDRSADFAFSKAAGARCRHLQPDCRCAIHPNLALRGFPGCAVYECHGAGPRVTHALSHLPEAARHEAFLVLRAVHELLFLLTEAIKLCPAMHVALKARLAVQVEQLDRCAAQPWPELGALDVTALHMATHALLRQVGHALGGRRGRVREL